MENQSIIDYSIESLSAIFANHARSQNNNYQKDLEEYRNNNPGQPLPEHLKDSFNLCLALCIMCKEIKALHDKVTDKPE